MKNQQRVCGRDLFNKFRSQIYAISCFYAIFPKKVRVKLLILHRNTRGNVGLVLRYSILRSLSKRIGDNVGIHQNVYIFNPESIEIGHNVSIHPMCYIDGAGGIKIGNDVSLAHNVSILSFNHNYRNKDIPIKYQNIIGKETVIGNNVWVGCQSVILAGVSIGSNSVIGAGAVVTRDIPEGSVAAGTPARVISSL